MKVLLALLMVIALAAAPLDGESVAMQGDTTAGHHMGHGGHQGDGDCGSDDCGSADLAICCGTIMGSCTGASADLRQQETSFVVACSRIAFTWQDQVLRGLQPETELPPPRV